MTAAQKKTLNKLISALEQVQADTEALRDELQEAYDGMSETAQEGEKGEALQQHLSDLEDAIDSIQSARDTIGSFKEDPK